MKGQQHVQEIKPKYKNVQQNAIIHKQAKDKKKKQQPNKKDDNMPKTNYQHTTMKTNHMQTSKRQKKYHWMKIKENSTPKRIQITENHQTSKRKYQQTNKKDNHMPPKNVFETTAMKHNSFDSNHG